MSTPVVLVPGMLCDPGLWAPVRGRVAAPVLDAAIDASTIGGMADQVLAAAPERFVLTGLSLGAIVGFEVLNRAPERVAGFCAISTNAAAPRPDQYAAWRTMAERTRSGGFGEVVRDELLPAMFAEAAPAAEQAEAFTGMAHRVGPEAFLRQLAAQATRTDAGPSLARVRCPTAVICGAADALCPPRVNRAVADAVPGALFRILPGAGHLCTLTHGRQVAGVLGELLAAVEGPSLHPRPAGLRGIRG
ncbi:alpha/beta fold hydrolase [Nocardiopsis composta]|uniref:Pimeloyl-ACP methyl ester carboxylesterase n=1 Tax=Nocardiopsis composta TaxID=157465 RepID=A0A7W8QQY4_9ACTN|nr:alpha/beta fold hydrolase [Nocardiopsis composta]MBB5434001.1 pimeloyl-ACP methyl ester carboxylesterase [Nocardiopsis composta]